MTIAVIDPFGVQTDTHMTFLARVLDPAQAGPALGRLAMAGGQEAGGLRAIRVTRYKPERRCLIEYDLDIGRMPHPCQSGSSSGGDPTPPRPSVTWIGKVRARGLDRKTFTLLGALRRSGFDGGDVHGVAVPEPVGVIPAWQMWLQRKMPGRQATQLVAGTDGINLAGRIAEAILMIHQAGVPARRRHTMTDELDILRQRLASVATLRPEWDRRLSRVLEACGRIGAAVPDRTPRGIHRDFYPDQVIVGSSHLYFVDFDLYCLGDPALDIGNFVGHLAEQALRTLGDADAFRDVQGALVERYLMRSGMTIGGAINVYATLTLARHIALSAQFPDRRPWSEPLLDLCEKRLDLVARSS